MLQGFEFATATRIVFGTGKLSELPQHVRELGVTRVLLVTGSSLARRSQLQEQLAATGMVLQRSSVTGEPTVEQLRAELPALREAGVQAVISVGGGSVIDAGKALAALAANGGDPLDYLEVVGRGAALTQPSLPFIAVPTTAGTGAEVTRNAVLGSEQHRVKASLRSPHMLPRLALIDPDLLQGAPPAVLRASGLDALSQLIEPLLSVRANPLTDALARAGLVRSARSLRPAVLHGPDAQQREDLALASLFGGLCLANSGLGAVHGFAGPVGGMFAAPHGAVCAALLPHVLEVNLQALDSRGGGQPARARFDELAQLLTADPHAHAVDAIRWVRGLCAELQVPGLSSYGMREADVPQLVSKAKQASSMRGNPLTLSDEELTRIASQALAAVGS